MKTPYVCFVVLVPLAFSLHAQVPAEWSPDGVHWYPGAAPTRQYVPPPPPKPLTPEQIAEQQRLQAEAQQRALESQKKATAYNLNESGVALSKEGVAAYNRGDWQTAIADFQTEVKDLQDALKNSPDDTVIQNNLKQAQTDLQRAQQNAQREADDKARDSSEKFAVTPILNQLVSELNNGFNQNPSSAVSGQNAGLDFVKGDLSTSIQSDSGSELQLKDAVADSSGDRKLFEKKSAIQAVLNTKAYGQAGVSQLAAYLPGAGANPELGSALERAKAEINKVFDSSAPDVGHFDSVALAGQPGSPQLTSQTLQVPEELKQNPRFQKLIIEHNALVHQDQEIQKQIENIKADPTYTQNSKSLTKLDQLQSAQNGVRGMAGYLNNLATDVVAKKVSIDSVDFSESSAPKKTLDNIQVPSP